jgi:enoyl-CoA hydratase/carnithine racemase
MERACYNRFSLRKDVTMNTVTLIERAPVIEIVLNRAERRNAVNRALLHDLDAALDAAERLATDAPATWRAAVLRGDGPVFCAGLDLTAFTEWAEVSGEGWRDNLFGTTEQYQRVTNRIEALALPVIALVHGAAIGLGMELALAADFRIAAEGTRLQLPESRIGLIPDVGGTTRLMRLVGPARAKEYILTGKPFELADAERWGVVNAVVPAERLIERGDQLAAELAEAAPLAVRLGKKVIDGMDDVKRGLALEGWAQAALIRSEDFMAGAQAALTKSKPAWTGK